MSTMSAQRNFWPKFDFSLPSQQLDLQALRGQNLVMYVDQLMFCHCYSFVSFFFFVKCDNSIMRILVLYIFTIYTSTQLLNLFDVCPISHHYKFLVCGHVL